MTLIYKIGNIVEQRFSANTILMHCCNDIPAMGAGVAGAIAHKWPNVYKQYMAWNDYHYTPNEHTIVTGPLRLGEVQFINVDHIGKPNQLFIANIIGQRNTWNDVNGNPPVRYEALEEGFGHVRESIFTLGGGKPTYEVATVKLGAGLAGGDWNRVAELLLKQLVDKGITVTVFDLPPLKRDIK